MGNPEERSGIVLWLFVGVGALVLLLGGGYYFGRGLFPTSAQTPTRQVGDANEQPESGSTNIEFVLPHKGGIARTSTQPGSVLSFESVDLYAGVSGYMKQQSVDIGDHVREGRVLALVDVPDLEKQVQHNAAVVEQARARVAQAKAKLDSAKADVEAARANIPHAEALWKSKTAELQYRQLQLERMRDLSKSHSIEDKIVDESTSHRDAVREGEVAAKEAVNSSKANVKATEAKVIAAEADIKVAEAEVKVAQAELEKSQVMVSFATITAPFDGVITKRNFFRRDFVRSANENGSQPLLTVQKTDLLRVVVQIPDRDVPYCAPGKPAFIEVDALPGQKFEGKVSRIAQTEDPQTRLMHVEIDLPNPKGKLYQGMYGRVTIVLDQNPDILSLPSECLAAKSPDGKAAVFVYHDGHAHRVPVHIGGDNGVQVEVLSGLKADDKVILHPGGLSDGTAVEPVDREADADPGK
ncbi:MAG TPA: efflux RND transporter periplasmic adaptor subunit [Gemmataceae bacterium]|jgi:RND family efflux transporter MFP subunit|nr:efflux RND transporter periplasmic adaptor subunit [Gemmataceae bacterium]